MSMFRKEDGNLMLQLEEETKMLSKAREPLPGKGQERHGDGGEESEEIAVLLYVRLKIYFRLSYTADFCDCFSSENIFDIMSSSG